MADFNIKQSYLLNFFAQFHQIYKRLSKMRHFERYTFEFDNQQFFLISIFQLPISNFKTKQ